MYRLIDFKGYYAKSGLYSDSEVKGFARDLLRVVLYRVQRGRLHKVYAIIWET